MLMWTKYSPLFMVLKSPLLWCCPDQMTPVNDTFTLLLTITSSLASFVFVALKRGLLPSGFRNKPFMSFSSVFVLDNLPNYTLLDLITLPTKLRGEFSPNYDIFSITSYFSRSKIPQHTFLRYSHYSSRTNYTHEQTTVYTAQHVKLHFCVF